MPIRKFVSLPPHSSSYSLSFSPAVNTPRFQPCMCALRPRRRSWKL